MKKKLCLLLSTAMLASLTATSGYTSVSASGNFISGYEDGTFRPDGRLTRAEAAAMMSQLIKGDSKKDVSFSDVDTSKWYYNALAELNAKEMLHSYGNTFEGGKNITRIEFAEFIYIYKNGYSEKATREDMFRNLISSGLISGYEDGTYRENGELTRAEAVALVNRMLGTKVDKENARDSFADVSKEHWAYADIYAATAKKDTGVVIANEDPTWGDKIEYQPGVTYPIAPPADQATKVMDKYNEKGSEWIPIGMINDDLRAKGLTIGSDGAQRPNDIGISSDGQLVFVGHDISTLHRSTDGGKTWQKKSSGIYPRTISGVEVDPNNKNNVIVFATTSYEDDGYGTNGIYLSKDMGETWKQVEMQYCGGGQLEWKTSLVWDASSYDEEIGGSSTAYWSKNYRLFSAMKLRDAKDVKRPEGLTEEEEGLFKTTDGGETWTVVNSEMSDSCLAVHPTKGIVYAGNLDGFFRSEDGGKTFEKVLGGSMVYGLDVIPTYPDRVYINDVGGVMVSEDCGKTFTRVESTTFPVSKSTTDPNKAVGNLKVNQQNPNNMLVTYYSGFGAYDSRVYYSNDGGVTWAQSAEDYTGYFFKNNDREAQIVWDPTDANKAFAYFGDYVSASTDGGKTFHFSADGMCDVAVDQRTVFNLYDPDIFYYGAGDFIGGITKDNGENWEWPYKMYGQSRPTSGYIMGCYATADGHMFANCILKGAWGGTVELLVSHDWGENWENTGIVPCKMSEKRYEFIFQSPSDENVIFVAGNDGGYRTKDMGYTWEKMPVDTVHCWNPYGQKEIYAEKGGKEIFVSYDNGDTWEPFITPSYILDEDGKESGRTPAIWDMAYDGINNILYYVGGDHYSGRHFVKVQNGVETNMTDIVRNTMLPAHSEHTRGPSFQLCTVDPRYPQVIYVGGYSNVLQNPAGVIRSVDGGESFQILSNTNPEHTIVKTGQTGGIEPYDLIVHPVTGELWVAQCCAGWMKIAPPYEN